MKKLLLVVLFCTILTSTEEVILSSIPNHLIECYQNGGPILSAPRRLDVFISLIRRLELNSRLDMRLFSTALLRSLRLDGIEEAANIVRSESVLPFRASAFQFHKYKLLIELFLPSQSDVLNVDEGLNNIEKCLLHKMLSSTVRPWERGDESLVCPLTAQNRPSMAQSSNRVYSRCPIEVGVIQTDWGTISPGTLVAALASSLEAQRVSISDILTANIFKEEISQALLDSAIDDWHINNEAFDIDRQDNDSADISNIWVATLAGDLAEVVVNQGPRVGASSQRLLVGSNNRWNDTMLPRNYYIFPPNGTLPNWHFTDAEILAGIDGLILANYLPKWVGQRRSLRLSQVIEMYYSNEGVSFEPSVRACNRHALFSRIVNSSQLLGETSRFAHILSLQQITVYIPKEEMLRFTEAAVSAFENYLPLLLRQNDQECGASSNVPVIDLIVATDGSWKGYEVEQFMSWIGGALEIETQRSAIGLLHGNNGQWIAPLAHNLTSLFTTITNSTVEWPNRLNLPNVLSRIIQYSRNETLQQITDKKSASHNAVVLIISPTDQPSVDDLERARVLMNSLRSTFFDIYFAYVAQDMSTFQNINNAYLDYSEMFLTVNSNSVKDVINAIEENLVKSIIPSRIFGAQCPVNGTEFYQVPYEDYVLPGREQQYRIHPFYLKQQPIVHVQLFAKLNVGKVKVGILTDAVTGRNVTCYTAGAYSCRFYNESFECYTLQSFRNDGQGQILVCMWRGAEVSRSCHIINERNIYIFNLTDPCPSPEFCPPAHFAVAAMKTQNLCAHNECRLPHQVGYYLQHSGFRCLPLLGAAATLSPHWKVYVGLSLMISLLYLH